MSRIAMPDGRFSKDGVLRHEGKMLHPAGPSMHVLYAWAGERSQGGGQRGFGERIGHSQPCLSFCAEEIGLGSGSGSENPY